MYKHDVFISFIGDNTSDNFIRHLDDALRRKQINACIDGISEDGESPEKDEGLILPILSREIEGSKMSIVVFSETYAFSGWCLDELVHILKCKRERGQIVVPVFHGVDRLHVKEQLGSYELAFLAHERLHCYKLDKVAEWRAALEEAANLSGWNSQDWGESNVIEKIVKDVIKKLNHTLSKDSLALDTRIIIGVANLVEKMESLSHLILPNIRIDLWIRVVFDLFFPRFGDCRFLRGFVAVFSAISGLIFLSQSSFFKLQFNDSKLSEILFFGILCALLVFFVFMAPNWGGVLHKVWNLNLSTKLTIECMFMGIVWMLAFLIKYPRFDINSKYRESCFLAEQGKEVSNGSQYTLFSVGAFSLLAVLLSSETQKTVELGFFSILIGLIMDTSMEIPTTEDGPKFLYILGSVIYCVGLILFKQYVESSSEISFLPIRLRRDKRRNLRETHRNSLAFFSTLVGVVFLFLSPFSKQQFEDSANLKGICFITFSLLLGFSLLKARDFIDILVVKCHEMHLAKAAVKILLFSVFSVIMFLTKYPRFKLHSELKESCKERNREKLKSQRNQFDVYSTASFSLFALTMSSGKEQPVKLGIFNFLLELTMDASIEILGNDDEPKFSYVVFSAVYCASLILLRSYLDSLIDDRDVSFWQSYQDQQDLLMAPRVMNV